MRVLAINHQLDAGPGVFAESVVAAGGELHQWRRADTDVPPGDPLGYDAVMTLGGSMNVDQEALHPWVAEERALLAELIERETPLLGVCLGAQLVAAAAGGDATRAPSPEVGWYEVEVTPAGRGDPIIGPLAPRFDALEWHGYECDLPPEATVLAQTPLCTQAFRIGDSAWGIQFHAEVTTADAGRWIDDYGNDIDAIRVGIDPDRMRAETLPRMPAWNRLGRDLCDRFLAVVRARTKAGV